MAACFQLEGPRRTGEHLWWLLLLLLLHVAAGLRRGLPQRMLQRPWQQGYPAPALGTAARVPQGAGRGAGSAERSGSCAAGTARRPSATLPLDIEACLPAYEAVGVAFGWRTGSTFSMQPPGRRDGQWSHTWSYARDAPKVAGGGGELAETGSHIAPALAAASRAWSGLYVGWRKDLFRGEQPPGAEIQQLLSLQAASHHTLHTGAMHACTVGLRRMEVSPG